LFANTLVSKRSITTLDAPISVIPATSVSISTYVKHSKTVGRERTLFSQRANQWRQEC
jgi:hypothetical protein